MRVALLGPRFHPGRSYQENLWAAHLAALGYAVRVFCGESQAAGPSVQHDPLGDYELQAVATQYLPRGTYRSRNLAPAVRDFEPELIVVFGDKMFSRPVAVDPVLARVPLITTFSENLGMHEFDWRKRGLPLRDRARALAFAWFRGPAIRTLCRRSTLIIGNTPQSRTIVLRLFRRPRERTDIDNRLIDRPLGFSPQHFHVDAAARASLRASWNLADDHVLVCASSAFTPMKRPHIRLMILALMDAMRANDKLRAVIVGFASAPDEQAAISKDMRDLIAASPFAARFIPEPFAGTARLAEIYNASDIALFARPSISCQEALGTGLTCIFADDGALNHLITQPDQADFFRPGDQVNMTWHISHATARLAAMPASARAANRVRLAEASRWLGYDRIIASVMDELRIRLPRPS